MEGNVPAAAWRAGGTAEAAHPEHHLCTRQQTERQEKILKTLKLVSKWQPFLQAFFMCFAGRQVKMAFVNSVAKPPRDVRRRQERFGTSSGLSSAASITAASPIKWVNKTIILI